MHKDNKNMYKSYVGQQYAEIGGKNPVVRSILLLTLFNHGNESRPVVLLSLFDFLQMIDGNNEWLLACTCGSPLPLFLLAIPPWSPKRDVIHSMIDTRILRS